MIVEHLCGSCLCEAVTYRVNPPFRSIIGCHCVQCRKQTGHFMAASAAKRENLTIISDEYLTWYESGPTSRRGFCGRCGSTLFFEAIGSGQVSFAAGTVDGVTGLTMTAQIFTTEKGDYYAVPDKSQIFDAGCASLLSLVADHKDLRKEISPIGRATTE
ncbi:MAG: GFA family protein [Hyphomicrobiaceae bacterium]